jgi:hypothetical protein
VVSHNFVLQGRAVDEDLLDYYSEKATVDDVAGTQSSTHDTNTLFSMHSDSQFAPFGVTNKQGFARRRYRVVPWLIVFRTTRRTRQYDFYCRL